ncbi:hypothetical protein FIV42_08620 [Persicimonas caeni]|uniref:Uncharacterized protein n=1 Tax=Persicimonas caeni TaxID=2292766 RepID=A0A4Y6PRC2_PERCE|nr:hypothetical protein [Persicimonas caeni]QDG50790.1 hypothetical protein FIV42_08620 [Persicimonas caeni]QED32011.1 hypothetical protein FRD00_08615 [Persicimonas caeni]
MSESIELRTKRLVRELLTVHLDPFLILLAEEGVAVADQRRRMDALVRALLDVGVDDTLSDGGRPVPVMTDLSQSPPSIRLHKKLIDNVDDSELLLAFQQPVSEILGISQVGVGLVLQSRDDRKLKSLTNKAARQLGGDRVHLTQIPAIVEQRMSLFEERLSDFAEQFGDSVFLLLSGMDDFTEKLKRAKRGWPDWSVVERSSFMKGAVEEIGVAVEGLEDAPDPAALVELCWESLALSPQSFLRHAAQKLRAEQSRVDVEQALLKLARIVDEESGELTGQLQEWSAYGELANAWSELFREEQRALAFAPGRRSTPPVSVFGLPLQTMRLCEPDSLPWDAPLLSWSMREHNALRDLLVGMRRSLAETLPNSHGEICDITTKSDEKPLQVAVADSALQVQVVAGEHSLPDNYDELLARALQANHQAMLRQFERLEASQRKRLLQTLRSAYGGYFGEAKAVWDRRFQAWQKWDEREAFTILCTEVRHVLGAQVIFDPFQDPRESQLRMVPTFTVIVPRPEDTDRTMLHVPLAALRNTFQDTPVRVRVVEVFDDTDQCIWGGDLDVTLQTVEEHKTETVLKSIENDSVRLLVYESLMSTGRIG